MRPGIIAARSGLQQECYGNIPRNKRARNFHYHKHVTLITRAAQSRYPSLKQVCLVGCAALIATSSLPIAHASNTPRVPDAFLRGLLDHSITATFPADASCTVNSFCWTTQRQSSSRALIADYDCQLNNRVTQTFQCVTFRRMDFLAPSQGTGCVSASDNWEFQAAQNRLARDTAARSHQFLRISTLDRRIDEPIPPQVASRAIGGPSERLSSFHRYKPRIGRLPAQPDPYEDPFQNPLDHDPFHSPIDQTPFHNPPGPPIIFEANPVDKDRPQENPVSTRKPRKRKKTTPKKPGT